MVVGYTGLAKIDGQKTDDWILDVVSSVAPYSSQKIIRTLAERASNSFEALKKWPSPMKRHAFLISGWARFDSRDAPLTPFVCAISNALDPTGNWLANAQNEFKVGLGPLRDHPYFFAAVGQPIKTVTLNRVMRGLSSYVSRERGPEAYIQLLANAIRETAGHYNNVGKNLMAISLPVAAVKSGFTAMAIPLGGPLSTTEPFALYLPEGDEPIRYAPHYTCKGMLIKDFELDSSP